METAMISPKYESAADYGFTDTTPSEGLALNFSFCSIQVQLGKVTPHPHPAF